MPWTFGEGVSDERPRAIVPMNDDDLLELLAADEGFEDSWAMVEEFALDSVQPGICKDPDCLATTSRCEPDARTNWCHACENNTVRSVGVLAGLC